MVRELSRTRQSGDGAQAAARHDSPDRSRPQADLRAGSGTETGPETRSGPAPDEAHLAETAENALLQRDFRFTRCVECECADGVLILRGRVPSYYLKQLAQAAVAEVEGINQIENRLDVFMPTGVS